MNRKIIQNKNLIVFDLDGTLTESKSPMHADMAALLRRLLRQKKVAIIGGGRWEVQQEQFLEKFSCPPKLLRNLYLFPTTATAMYRYDHGWSRVYAHELEKSVKQKIFTAFTEVFKELHYTHPKKIYGELIEDRGTQVSFSALGQDVVKVLGTKRGVYLKDRWGKSGWKEKIAKAVQKKLPQLTVRAAGYSTIDVTKKGIDKAYGLRQIQKHLHVPIARMLFIGDAILPGGNDYAVVKTGVDYIKISGPKETKKIIQALLVV